MSAQIAKLQIGSPLQHEWKIENMPDEGCLFPDLFQGPMTSELLDSLLCACCGTTHTCKTCVCKEHNLGFSELCPCYGSDGCHHFISHIQITYFFCNPISLHVILK